MASSCKLAKHIPLLITILLMAAFTALFPMRGLSPARLATAFSAAIAEPCENGKSW